MLKGFRIKGVDGGWLRIDETENKESARLCIDHGDSQSVILLDADGMYDLSDLKHKLDVQEKVEE